MTSRTRLERKQVDDVLGGEEMWKHADSIAGKNPILPRLLVCHGPRPLGWISSAVVILVLPRFY